MNAHREPEDADDGCNSDARGEDIGHGDLRIGENETSSDSDDGAGDEERSGLEDLHGVVVLPPSIAELVPSALA